MPREKKGRTEVFSSIRTDRGFSLIELVIAMAIFATVIVGLYRVYDTQFRQQAKEFRIAESEVELGIAKNLIERDLIMTGYGIQDDYAGITGASSRTVEATEGGASGSDTLTLRGTALGISSRAAQGWDSVVSMESGSPIFSSASSTIFDPREKISPTDRIIITNPSGESGKTIVKQGSSWLFEYDTLDSVPPGTQFSLSSFEPGYVLYGLNKAAETDAGLPYYTVRYYLSSSSGTPGFCGQGTRSLLRAETRSDTLPAGDPVMNCVLDLEVAFGLTSSATTSDPGKALNFPIDTWDTGGAVASGYTAKELNQRLKQIRVYILVQEGNRDAGYTYVNPDPNASAPDKIRVGELGLVGGATGRDYLLTPEQRKYRWRVLTIVVTPRNIRG